jgi:hypothetical protein
MDKKLFDTLMAGLAAAERMYKEEMHPTTNIKGQYALFGQWIKDVRKAKAALKKHAPTEA